MTSPAGQPLVRTPPVDGKPLVPPSAGAADAGMDPGPDRSSLALGSRDLELRGYWTELAMNQLERERKGGWDSQVRAIQDELIASHPHLGRPDAIILDCGSGPGTGSSVFREAGAHVIANDISDAMADVALQAVPPFERVVVASAANGINQVNMGVAPGSLDAILMIGSLHSIPARRTEPGSYDEKVVADVLKSAFEALKPGGVLPIFFLPTIADGEKLAKLNPNTTPLDPATLEQQLRAAGFEIRVNKRVQEAYDNPQLGALNYQVIEAVKPF